jgi:hypothetical protein
MAEHRINGCHSCTDSQRNLNAIQSQTAGSDHNYSLPGLHGRAYRQCAPGRQHGIHGDRGGLERQIVAKWQDIGTGYADELSKPAMALETQPS